MMILRYGVPWVHPKLNQAKSVHYGYLYQNGVAPYVEIRTNDSGADWKRNLLPTVIKRFAKEWQQRKLQEMVKNPVDFFVKEDWQYINGVFVKYAFVDENPLGGHTIPKDAYGYEYAALVEQKEVAPQVARVLQQHRVVINAEVVRRNDRHNTDFALRVARKRSQQALAGVLPGQSGRFQKFVCTDVEVMDGSPFLKILCGALGTAETNGAVVSSSGWLDTVTGVIVYEELKGYLQGTFKSSHRKQGPFGISEWTSTYTQREVIRTYGVMHHLSEHTPQMDTLPWHPQINMTTPKWQKEETLEMIGEANESPRSDQAQQLVRFLEQLAAMK